jgi:hypothetical protein
MAPCVNELSILRNSKVLVMGILKLLHLGDEIECRKIREDDKCQTCLSKTGRPISRT